MVDDALHVPSFQIEKADLFLCESQVQFPRGKLAELLFRRLGVPIALRGGKNATLSGEIAGNYFPAADRRGAVSRGVATLVSRAVGREKHVEENHPKG